MLKRLLITYLVCFVACASAPNPSVRAEELTEDEAVVAEDSQSDQDESVDRRNEEGVQAIAVVPFRSADISLGESTAAHVLAELQSAGRFTLVERGQIEEAYREIAHTQSGMVRDDNIIELGQQLGAQFMVVGEIERIDNDYVGSMRVIRTETGIVIGAHRNTDTSLLSVREALAHKARHALGIYLLMTNPDSPYSILIRLNKGQNPDYSLGETVELKFQVKRHRNDAPAIVYLQLYSINAVGAMTLIYPNKFSQQEAIQVDQEYSLPGPDDDFQWTLVPPIGSESIQAIVTTRPVDFFRTRSRYRTEAFPEVGQDTLETYGGIQTEINQEQLRDWSAERVTYEVHQE